jgi:hypothetical protein
LPRGSRNAFYATLPKDLAYFDAQIAALTT